MVRKSDTSHRNVRLPPIEVATTSVMADCDDSDPDALACVSDIPKVLASEGRLGVVTDIANKRREHISNINDMQKERLRMENSKLEKQLLILAAQFEKEVKPVRRSFEELKATQFYWERKRCLMKEQTKMHKGMFGSFEGINKFERREEVRKIIDASQPSKQRQRKVNKLKETGKQDGRISDDVNIMRRFNAMMNRPFKTPIRRKPKVMLAEKTHKKRSFRLPPLAAVIQDNKGYGNFFSSGPVRLTLEES